MRIFHNPDHDRHDSRSELHDGQLGRSFECPERMAVIRDALAAAGFAPPAPPPAPVPRALLERVHAPAYLDFLETAHARWVAAYRTPDAIAFTYPVPGLRRTAPPAPIAAALGYWSFSVDTCITEGSWGAARSAAACARAAALAAAEGPAFALARPPGHHAHGDLFGGYCYLNNAAIAAETLLEAGAARVAVLDIDYHHGNGTQAIFYGRGDVLTVSIHADPVQAFPYFLGHADEGGTGAGEGCNMNLPLPEGTAIAAWRAALDTACRRIAGHGAEALVVSLGVDTYEGDPISRFRLAEGDFPGIGARIARLRLPTVFVMEGGYAIAALGRNVAGVLGGFLGR
ncbi:acetylpolyamine amidohydrolase AphA [Paralimibaculum aggregatum]|uniref:Acetylpolyamine amidohydrolase AphA n=1 Tax=Paralimibaculum aggregatum TaxID=3036245 RepID=A0ABQ6LNA6_9RHOB|nr:histone deacetylase family protein [Limibaculum sp. NKW23]GMG84692.1 acetylpolyamine amidohydrolase AphA [Limibaculum sp. NKW23]